MKSFSGEGLKSATAELRNKIESGQILDDILPEAFAAVREASRRTLYQRHFDVQLLGGIIFASRENRRDADRRGQDFGRHFASVS